MNVELKKEIKEEILEMLKDNRPRDAISIVGDLNYGNSLDPLIYECIRELEANYDLYYTKKGSYILFSNSEYAKKMKKGIFQEATGGYGFVIVEGLDEDIFIPATSKGNANNGDLVLVNITKGAANEKKCEGKIEKIISHANNGKVGEVVFDRNKCYVKLISSKKSNLIRLIGDTKRLVDGDLVVLEMNDNGATFKNRIGHKNDPGIDIVAVLVEHEFDTEFPKDVEDELTTIPTTVSDAEMEGRRDLRDKVIFTIDGDDTKDVDDAISLDILDNGNYQLGVHIASVPDYVKEDSPLDREARKRGTSVYLADRVVPMLPHQLSNGICSLNELVDRLAMSCVMEIDTKGNMVNYEIFPSVINSKKKMTYKKVNSIIEDGIVPDGYEPFKDVLLKMKELADIVRARKTRQGYIDFDTDELKIIVDENAKVTDIVKRERGAGEKLIEDFMILANEAVATQFMNFNVPGVYRVHDEANEEKLKKFVQMLEVIGIRVNESLSKVNQQTIQRIVKKVKEENPDAFQVLSSYMLRCMSKAKYQTKNIGHYALALRNYTHFTSPIRRYPDLTTHRLLHEYFFSKDGMTEEKIDHYESMLDEICLTSSERERASIECEREVDKMKSAEYMEGFVGEEYEGIISGMTSNGIYVLLPNLVEGMIPFKFCDEQMNYDKEREIVVSAKTHTLYTIGMKIKVKVLKASKDLRQIDFIEVKELNKKKTETQEKFYENIKKNKKKRR